MLKVALKSRFVQIFIVVLIVLTTIICFTADGIGTALQNLAQSMSERSIEGTGKYMTYTMDHVSGKYSAKGNDSGWKIISSDGEVLYETKNITITLANREGYVWEQDEQGLVSIVNFKTGETEWKGVEGESVICDNAGFWIIKNSGDEKDKEKEHFYLLDKNYNPAADGIQLDSIGNETRHGSTSNYIYGQKQDVAYVIDSKGEVVYKQKGAHVWFVEDDIANVYLEDREEDVYIRLKGSDMGQIVEVKDNE